MTAFWSGWVDAHCHLTDTRVQDLDGLLSRSMAAGGTGFVLAGVDPDDWKKQLQFSRQFPQLWPVFGVHPYFVLQHGASDCEQALDLLAQQLGQTRGLLGEMGLDFRPNLWRSDVDTDFAECRARQLECFRSQLELAQVTGRAVVLHLVRAFQEAVQLLALVGVPSRGGYVHAFNGSADQAQVFLDLGLHLSVGGALCRTGNERLRRAVKRIPLDRILIESDSPDQPPENWPLAMNEPTSVLLVAAEVARLHEVDVEDVLASSKQNLRGLLGMSSEGSSR